MGGSRLGTALAAIVACALVLAAAAHAHGDTPGGFRSSVEAISPPLPGLLVDVIGGDDQLQVTNRSGRELVVEGYQGEPYVRFSAAGVFQNERSPAVYLNADRYGEAPVPPDASPSAPPRWAKVGDGDSYAWHDHRIQWMSRTLPPSVLASPDERQRIFSWRVPAKADGSSLTIAGSLEYGPVGSGAGPRWWLLAALVGLAAIGGGAALVMYGRRPAEA